MEPLAGHAMEASTVLFGSYVKGHSRDLLAQAQPNEVKTDSKLTAAETWLRELLSNGPVESSMVQDAAKAAAQSWSTVRRAKDSLKVEDYKEPGRGGRWKWSLSTEGDINPKSHG